MTVGGIGENRGDGEQGSRETERLGEMKDSKRYSVVIRPVNKFAA